MHKKTHHNNIRLYFIYSCFGSLTFHQGIFILFLLQEGLSNSQIGTLQTALFVTSFLLELPTGLFGDKFSRKLSLMAGLTSLCIFGLGMAFCHDYWLFLLLFMIKGAGYAMISGSGDALIYDSLADIRREASYLRIKSRLMAVSSVTLGIAVFLGGLMKNISWSFVYLSYVAAMLIALVAVLFIKEAPPVQVSEKADPTSGDIVSFRHVFRFFRSGKGIWLLAFIFAYGIYEGTMTPYYVYSQNLFHEYDFSAAQIGLLFSVIQFISGGAYLLAERIRDKLGMTWIAILLTGASSCFFLLNAFQSPVIAVCAFLVLNTLPEILYPVMHQYIQDRSPAKIRASVLSVYSFIHSLLMALGYSVIATLFDFYPVYQVISMMSVMPLIAMCLLWLYFKVSQQQSSAELLKT